METEHSVKNRLLSNTLSLYQKRIKRMYLLLDDAEEITVLIEHTECKAQFQTLLLAIKTTLTSLSPQAKNSRNQAMLKAIVAKWQESETAFKKKRQDLLAFAESEASDYSILQDVLNQIAEVYQSNEEPTLTESKIQLLTTAFQAALNQIASLIKQEKASTSCFLCYAPNYFRQRISQLRENLQQAGIIVLDLWEAKNTDIVKYVRYSNYVLVIGTPTLKQAWEGENQTDQQAAYLHRILRQLKNFSKFGSNIIKLLYEGSEETSFPDFLDVQTSQDFHRSDSYYSSTFLTLLQERLLQHLSKESLQQLAAIKAGFTQYETAVLEAKDLAELEKLETREIEKQRALFVNKQSIIKAEDRDRKRQDESLKTSSIYSGIGSSFRAPQIPLTSYLPNSTQTELKLREMLATFYEQKIQVQYSFYDLPAIPISQAPRLALVEELQQKEKEQITLSEMALGSRDERLNFFEKIYSPKTPIALEDLFIHPTTSFFTSNTKPQSKLLISGRAGIGKTTLCKQIVYHWAENKEASWIQKYRWIWWIPLRNLTASFYTARTENISLAETIHRECFDASEAISINQITALLAEPDSFLLLLDGFDEVVHVLSEGSPLHTFVEKKLLHYPNILVTTRPYAISDALRQYKRFEIIGFLNKDIKEYVKKFFHSLKESIIYVEKLEESNQTLLAFPTNVSLQKELFPKESLRATETLFKKQGYSLGRTIDNRDCFYEAIAQALNVRKTDNNFLYTINSLRELCSDYIQQLDQRFPFANWVKRATEKDKELENYQGYLATEQYTEEEMLDFKQARFFTGHAIRAKLHIEGRILAKQLNVTLHVVKFHENETTNENLLPIHLLVTADEVKEVEAETINYTDDQTLHLAMYHNHFVPILPTSLSAKNILGIQKDKKKHIDQLVEKSRKLLAFLKKYPSLWGIAHTPLNLELICGLWEEKQSQSQMSSSSIGMTEIYEELILKFYERYLLKRSQNSIDKKELEQHWTTERIQTACQPITEFLSELAYQSFTTSQLLLIDKQLIQKLRFQYEEKFFDSFHEVLEVGVLKNVGKQTAIAEQGAYFLHVSLQEYYAARFIATALASNNDKNQEEMKRVIENYAKDTRYQMVWEFVAGLLRYNLPALQQFFDYLLIQAPPSLNILFRTGAGLLELLPSTASNNLEFFDKPQHFYWLMLTLRCLEESHIPAIKQRSSLLALYIEYAKRILFEQDPYQYKKQDFQVALNTRVTERYSNLLSYLRSSPRVLSASLLIPKLKVIQAQQLEAYLALELLESDEDPNKLLKDKERFFLLRQAALKNVPNSITQTTAAPLPEDWTSKGDDQGQYEPAFWYNKGTVLYNQGHYELALVCYNKVLELDPKDEAAWQGKARILEELEQYEEVLVCYDKLLELNPKDGYAWRRKAGVLQSLKWYEEALDCYDKVLELDPQDKAAWHNKGWVLYAPGRYEKALACYDKALKLDPTYVDAWHGKGWVLDKQGQYKQALVCYDKALELNPEYGFAWNGKGWMLYCQDNHQEALHCYNQALHFAPNYKYALAKKGMLLLLNRTYWAEADTLFHAALKEDPSFPYVLQGLGLLAHLQEQQDKAQHYFTQVKEYHEGKGKADVSDQLELYYVKLKTFFYFNHLEEARKSFEEIRLLKPNFALLCDFSQFFNSEVLDLFYQVVSHHDKQALDNFLDKNPVNLQEPVSKSTMLHLCAQKIILLIGSFMKKDCDVNKIQQSIKDFADIIHKLIQSGADPNKKNMKKETPIQAMFEGCPIFIEKIDNPVFDECKKQIFKCVDICNIGTIESEQMKVKIKEKLEGNYVQTLLPTSNKYVFWRSDQIEHNDISQKLANMLNELKK